MNKYLIEFYPVKPKEWFYVLNIDDIGSDYYRNSIYKNYKRGLKKYNKTESELLGFSNGWWQTIEADSVFEAIDIFRKNLKEDYEQHKKEEKTNVKD